MITYQPKEVELLIHLFIMVGVPEIDDQSNNSINAFDMSLDPGRYDLIVLFDICLQLYTPTYSLKNVGHFGVNVVESLQNMEMR